MTTARPRILLTHTPEMRANYYGAAALSGLQALGEVLTHERGEPLDAAGVVTAARSCRFIVADRATALPAGVFDALPDLVAVLRVAMDIRNIDVAAASRAGILVTHASRSWIAAVSELAIGLMIDAARGISAVNIATKTGVPPAIRMGRQLAGATAGIVGYGPLGRRVAELCLAFGMRVVVHDPYVAIADPGIVQTSLEEVCRAADFLLPLVVATAETENLIGPAQFALMQPTAYLVNLSRGNLIDEAALTLALDARKIAGAALDVGRAPDQMPSPALARRADVSATPHIGGLTREAIDGQALETVAQVRAIVAGGIPAGAINADAATRLALLRS